MTRKFDTISLVSNQQRLSESACLLAPPLPPPPPHTHTHTQKQNKTKQKKHWENLDGKLDENKAVLKQFAPRKNENTFVLTEKNCPLTLENVDFRSLRM